MTARQPTDWKSPEMRKRIAARYASERRFRAIGLIAIVMSAGFLAYLLISMMHAGLGGFSRTEVTVQIDFPKAPIVLDPASVRGPNADAALAAVNWQQLTDQAAEDSLGKGDSAWLAPSAWLAVRDAVKANPAVLQQSVKLDLPASAEFDLAAKSRGTDEAEHAYARLNSRGLVHSAINWSFLTASDGTDPTQVGIWGAFKGSLLTMIVTLLLSFPVGVLAALYLEEYAPRNRWTDMIEVSINNLAAVPSIIFGLLGLAVFLNVMHLPRSAALVGGMTLALMTMPVIVIAGRNAIKAVPPSIRDAALGIGASPVQVVFHHVLPLALPGIMTGTIIGMARALGETAPLLMIGMRAFIASPPGGVTDPATVLPVQIFLWSDEVSKGFIEKTSAAIIVLLVFLLSMNSIAIYLRNKFERRW
ncbi:MAG: phosphate ABC transporter permease PstA [Sphingomonadaceae bacterium]|jgi:phosphate transport system permease protein